MLIEFLEVENATKKKKKKKKKKVYSFLIQIVP